MLEICQIWQKRLSIARGESGSFFPFAHAHPVHEVAAQLAAHDVCGRQDVYERALGHLQICECLLVRVLGEI